MSVKEVAEKTGLSQQTIYKRIKTDLKPFSTKLNGKFKLDKAVIARVVGEKTSESLNPVSTEREYIEFLKEQISLKDEQISALSTALNHSQILLKLEQDKTVKMLDMSGFSTSLKFVENERKETGKKIEQKPPEKEKKWWQIWK